MTNTFICQIVPSQSRQTNRAIYAWKWSLINHLQTPKHATQGSDQRSCRLILIQSIPSFRLLIFALFKLCNGYLNTIFQLEFCRLLQFLAMKTIRSIRSCFGCPISTLFQLALKLFQSLRLCNPTCFEPSCQLYIALSYQVSYLKSINMDMESPILFKMRFGETFPEAGCLHETTFVGISNRQVINRCHRARSSKLLHHCHETFRSGI
jgi:hypothetical protein